MMFYHVHMDICIPPKCSVPQAMGNLKGKSGIAVSGQFRGRRRNFNGETLWARGYAVSAVGFEIGGSEALYPRAK